jgi:hypothetical protein
MVHGQAIRHPKSVRRFIMCAVAPDMAGPTRAYVAERAEKVRVLSACAPSRKQPGQLVSDQLSGAAGRVSRDLSRHDPAGYAELSLALARLEMTAAD